MYFVSFNFQSVSRNTKPNFTNTDYYSFTFNFVSCVWKKANTWTTSMKKPRFNSYAYSYESMASRKVQQQELTPSIKNCGAVLDFGLRRKPHQCNRPILQSKHTRAAKFLIYVWRYPFRILATTSNTLPNVFRCSTRCFQVNIRTSLQNMPRPLPSKFLPINFSPIIVTFGALYS